MQIHQHSLSKIVPLSYDRTFLTLLDSKPPSSKSFGQGHEALVSSSIINQLFLFNPSSHRKSALFRNSDSEFLKIPGLKTAISRVCSSKFGTEKLAKSSKPYLSEQGQPLHQSQGKTPRCLDAY